METAKIIYGFDLKKYLNSLGEKKLAARIDPNGLNVVDIAILGEEDIRTFLMTKVIDSNDPIEVKIDFPIKTFNEISHTYIQDDAGTH